MTPCAMPCLTLTACSHLCRRLEREVAVSHFRRMKMGMIIWDLWEFRASMNLPARKYPKPVPEHDHRDRDLRATEESE